MPPIIETYFSENLPDRLPIEVIEEYIHEQEQHPVDETGEETLPFEPEAPVSYPIRPRQPARPAQISYAIADDRSDPDGFSVPVSASFYHPKPIPIPDQSKPPPVRDLINEETGQPLELYTGELITADNVEEGEELVLLSFSKPNQQVNFVSPNDAANRNNDNNNNNDERIVQQSFSSPLSEVYQAGYQQIDIPDQQRLGNPEELDPSHYHEDRPPIAPSARDPTEEYYPLGRPEPQRPPPERPVRRPIPASRKVPRRKIKPENNSSGGFFDFLFGGLGVGGNKNNAKKVPPNRRRNPPPPPPAPKRNKPKPVRTVPTGYPPPPPEIRHMFPPPSQLGGALNPIMIRLGPNGEFTPPASPPVALSQRPKQPRFDEESPVQETQFNARLGEEFSEETENENDNDNVVITSYAQREPMVIGFQYKPDKSQQVPFNSRLRLKPPAVFPAVPPQHPRRQQQQQQRLNLVRYRDQLRDDPEFHQNLTKSYVFHHPPGQPHEENADFDGREGTHEYVRPAQASSTTLPRPTQIQDLNPFDFRSSNANSVAQYDYEEEENQENEEEMETFPEFEFQEIELTTSPNLEDFTQTSKPAPKVRVRVIKPDRNIVYNPSTTTSSTTTSTTTTTTSTTTTQTTTTTVNPIADHVASLLRDYYSSTSTQNLPQSTTENMAVLEYLSPDGEHNTAPTENVILIKDESMLDQFFDTLTAPKPQEETEEDNELVLPPRPFRPKIINTDHLILPRVEHPGWQTEEEKAPTYDRVFEPSFSPQDSDWHVLDDEMRRVMNHDDLEEAESRPKTPRLENADEAEATKTNVEEEVGGFMPIKVAVTLDEDQEALN